MQNQVFRYGKLGLYHQINLLILFFLNLITIIRYSLFGDSTSWGDVLIFSVSLSFTIGGILSIIHHLTLKISLSNQAIIFQSSVSWGWRLLNKLDKTIFKGEIPYTSIEKIEDGDDLMKTLKIKIKEQKGHIVVINKFLEHGEEFINLFTSFLKTEQIDKLNKKFYIVNKTYPIVKLRLITLCIFTTVMLLLQMSFSYIDFYKSNLWEHALKKDYTYSISHDADGSIWAVTQKDEETITVWHISNQTQKQWIFPKSLCPICNFQFAGHNSENLPRIISHQGIVYAWDGHQWIKGETLDIDFYYEYIKGHDTVLWGRKNGNLAYVDFATNNSQEIPAPTEAITYGLELQDTNLNQDGTALAMYGAKDKPQTMLYRLKNQQWQLVLNVEDDLRTVFTLDSKSRVWALRYMEYFEPTYMLGYYDEENQVWKWQYVQSLYTDLPYIKDIAIDTLNRVWVSGGYGGNDFIQVLEWSENSISKIEEYNSYNSNIENSYSLFIANSGKLWFGGDLAWIDTKSTALPKPLPEWLAQNFQDGNIPPIIGWVGIGIPFLLFWISIIWESHIWEKEKSAQT